MATENVINRATLEFAKQIKDRFSFLELMGFRCVRSDATFVKFESTNVGINIYHGRCSFELGLELEKIESPEDSYSFSEILRLAGLNQEADSRNYATHTQEGVAEGARLLAELFRQCVATGILNDGRLFSRLRSQKKQLAKNYALEIELLLARKISEAAWLQKDYAAFAKTLRPLRSALTEIEVRKLAFAEKHLHR